MACGLGFVPSHLGTGASNAVALDTGIDGKKGGLSFPPLDCAPSKQRNPSKMRQVGAWLIFAASLRSMSSPLNLLEFNFIPKLIVNPELSLLSLTCIYCSFPKRRTLHKTLCVDGHH